MHRNLERGFLKEQENPKRQFLLEKIQDIVSSEEVVRLFQKYKTKNGQIIIIDKNLAKDRIWSVINEMKESK